MAPSASRLQEKAAARRGYGALATADDDDKPTTLRPPPKATSLWSALLFTYAQPLIELGNQRQLNATDLWENKRENQVEQAHAEFKDALAASDGRLLRGIVRAYGPRVALFGVASLIELASTLFAPVVLHHVIDAFTHETVDLNDLVVWLLAFFGLRLFSALVSAQVGFQMSQLVIRVTVSMRTVLFEKALRRASKTKASEAGGEDGQPKAETADLTNLFTADVQNLLGAGYQLHSIWMVPLQIVGVMILLYGVLGVAAFAGLAVIFLSIYVGGKIAGLSGMAFRELMQRKDARMKVIKEVFSAIQVVKLNGWDTRFTERILTLRAHELQVLWRTFFLSGMNGLLLWSSPMLVSICSFTAYTLVLEQQLTAAKVFTSMALFASIRIPLTTLPRVFAQCIQAKIAVDRMQAFMDAPEFDLGNVVRDGPTYDHDVAIDIRDGSFGWNKDSALLKNVNLTAKKGDLVVVHGSVGAGKSSLCLALLGEMEKICGSVFVRGRIAYYAQQTWIQNLSIRDNILFGKTYDGALYKHVLDSCGLLPDLQQFPGGDEAEIGQNGVNLSGGQKARLCLARACYADADVLILDSPLAAVDALVQAEIFRKCVCGLLENKTVVLVTHSPDIIASDAANFKIEISDGQVKGVHRDRKKPRRAYLKDVAARDDVEVVDSAVVKNSEAGSRLVEDERREIGRVSSKVIQNYFGALGGIRAGAILILILSAWQGSQIASDLWLSHWTGQKNAEYDESATMRNILIYMGLCGLTALLVFTRSIAIALIGVRSARHLFEAMTRSLLKAPLRFFDANPIGRITNRYGDDINAVDFMLPMGSMGVLSLLVFIICQLGTAVAMVKLLGVFVLPFIYMYVKTTAYYLEPSREISRLAKVSDSPVLSFVTGSEGGVVTLRAFGNKYVQNATKQLMELLNANSRAEFASSLINEWFELRILLVGYGILIVVVSALVYLHEILSPGTVGLAFTYTLNVQLQLIQVVGIWAFLETSMISPERILEYAAIRPEGEGRLLQIEPSLQWPQRGTIDFDNVVFNYKEGAPPVLKGLSFSIKNNEKIGIVGRTGAGKSSLTMALFRINELVSGRVMIDGVDISMMPLQSLRSHLSIIPQAPVLFKGPLRGYMDPFDDYSDDEIWTAFEKVEMKEQISALEGQLSYELSENGENFSVGERQMLCMARAMLTKSRIVVMDEATASIDHATEKKLQHMINRDFQEATVLTIAHRLATVLDSDRIMVLSEGRVVEFDTPANLVQKEGGVFYELAKEGGVLEKVTASGV